MTHTYVTVPVSPAIMAQIATILENDVAGWADAVERDSNRNITLIDMHGLALTPLVSKEEDFTLEAFYGSTMEYKITPRTEQAYKWLEKEYPIMAHVYHGASLWVTPGLSLVSRVLRVIDKIQKAGLTIDLTPV